MSTATPTILISSLARFVAGDIKGGAAAHAFRTDIIRTAIEQMFKGNYEPITEASALTSGKAKKARAYAAGFATFGVIGKDVTKVSYVGKLADAANKEARDRIDSLTKHHTATFFVAYDAVMAEKAAPKTPAVAVTVAPTVAPSVELDDDAMDTANAEAARHDMAVAQDDAVLTIVNLINGGMLTGEQMEAIDSALAAAEARRLAAEEVVAAYLAAPVFEETAA